jgi:hypothetical protein
MANDIQIDESSHESHAHARGPAPLKLEEFLPYRLNVLSSLMSQALSRVYASPTASGSPNGACWRRLANTV